MHLESDYIHPYTSGVGYPSKCRIRIYLSDEERDATVVICSELATNTGTSVTNAAEWVAGDVLKHHGLDGAAPVWIEHYPPEATDGREETFDLVLFSSYEVREVRVGGERRFEIGQPTWKRLDRRIVEALVGLPVQE
jgi:hypothetical protein